MINPQTFFGMWLVHEMLANDMDQRDLANAIGIHSNTISKHCNGKIPMSYHMVRRYVRYFYPTNSVLDLREKTNLLYDISKLGPISCMSAEEMNYAIDALLELDASHSDRKCTYSA